MTDDHKTPTEEHAPAVDGTQTLTVPGGSDSTRRSRRALLGCLILFPVGGLLGALMGVAYIHVTSPRSTEAPVTPAPAPVAEMTEPASSWADAPAPEVIFSASPQRVDRTPDAIDAGVPLIFCFFDLPDAPPTVSLAARWLQTGAEPADAGGEVTLEEADHLRGHIALSPPQGQAFAEGIYEVGMVVDGVRVVEGSFVVVTDATRLLIVPTGMDRSRPDVTEVVVSAGPPPRKPKKPYVLPREPAKVIVTFKYSHALPGTAFTVKWLYDGGLIAQATSEVNIQREAAKAEAWFAPKAPAKLPDGRYAVLVFLDEDSPPLAKADFWIGRKPTASELDAR